MALSASAHVPSCFSRGWPFVTPWTVAHQAPLSMGILQARTLEWVAISYSKGSFWPRDWTYISCISRQVLCHWATRETQPHCSVQFSSVTQSCLTVCDPMNRSTPCPSPTPGVHSDSRPSSQWCHPAISSSVIPFFSCPQSLPATVQYYIVDCVSWVPRLTLLNLQTNWAYEHTLKTEHAHI